MRIVCWQTILMKYQALFVIFEKVAKFEIVVCCKLWVLGGALWVNFVLVLASMAEGIGSLQLLNLLIGFN